MIEGVHLRVLEPGSAGRVNHLGAEGRDGASWTVAAAVVTRTASARG
jgi:hypothetical protein